MSTLTREKILAQVSEGKLTAQEAGELFDAIDAQEAPKEPTPEREVPEFLRKLRPTADDLDAMSVDQRRILASAYTDERRGNAVVRDTGKILRGAGEPKSHKRLSKAVRGAKVTVYSHEMTLGELVDGIVAGEVRAPKGERKSRKA